MVKVGQFLSSRFDVLPESVTRELAGLQDEVEPQPFHLIQRAIEAELGMPVDVAFDYIDNYRNVPTWMFGVSEFTPFGEFDQGLGATFDAAMQIGPSTLRSKLEVTEWEHREYFEMF